MKLFQASLRLHVVLGVTISALAVPPAVAQQTVVEMPVVVQVNFSDDTPKFLSFRGNVSEIEITEPAKMAGDHNIGVAFSVEKPKEVKLMITSWWSDKSYDTRRINLLPSTAEGYFPVRFFGEGPNTVLFTPFDESDLKQQVNEKCLGIDDYLDLRHFHYKRCFFIFSVYKTHDLRHSDEAFTALRGAFDKYYALIKEPGYPLSRDYQLEKEVLEFEAAARSDGAVENVFERHNVKPGYYKGMVGHIGRAEVAAYAGLQREANARGLTPEKVQGLLVETQLIKQRFIDEQARMNELEGQTPNVLNGITLDHFNDLERLLEARLAASTSGGS